MKKLIGRAACAGLLLLSIPGCDLPSVGSDQIPVELRLNSMELVLDDTASATLEATLIDADGEPITASTTLAGLIWTSADTTIAVVTGGTVRALRPGSAAIAVSLGQLTATVPVRVQPVVVALEVLPDSLRLLVSTEHTLSVQGRDRFGGVVSGLPVTWESADPTRVKVSDSGTVQGVQIGFTEVRAHYGTLVARVPTRVLTPYVNEIEEFTVSPDVADVRGTHRTLVFALRLRNMAGIERDRGIWIGGWSVGGSCLFSPAPQADGRLRCEITIPGETPTDTLVITQLQIGPSGR